MKKYEMIKEGNFYRIKALKDFSDVKKGDLGGLIEKESNLSHNGNCWIYNNARVYGNARVLYNAKVRGYVMINDDVEIYDNVRIFSDFEINNFEVETNYI